MNKKSLLILSASVLMALASCSQNPNTSSEQPSEEPATSETQPSSSEVPNPSSESSAEDVFYVITFDLNGGTLSDGSTTIPSQRVQEGRWAKKPSENPTKKNSTFLGWYAAGEDTQFSFFTQIWGNVTLVARYQVNEDQKVTLNFEPNGGTMPAGSSTTVETFIGDRINTPTPEREGYSFQGWFYKDSDGNEWAFTGIVQSDIAGGKIYAKWAAQNFNFYYSIKDDGTICIDGLIDVSTIVVSIPASIDGKAVTEISDRAFQSCINVQTISIPASVTKIGRKAFLGDYRISTITIDGSNPAYKSVDNIIYSKDGTELVYFPAANSRSLSSFAIPSGVTRVGDYAFFNTSVVASESTLNSITFPEGLVEIGDYAFYEQLALSSITFPSSLKKIGAKAFMMFDSTVQVKINWNEGLEEIGESAFSGIYLKGDLVLPSTLKVMGDYSFSRLNALETVVLPSSLEHFGDAAFFQNYGIKTIRLSDCSAYKVVNDILYTQDGSKLVYVPANWAVQTGLDQLTIPEGVLSLEGHCLSDLKFVTSISFPSTLTTIKPRAFHYNSTYKGSISLPDSVTTLGDEAFMSSSISSISFGSGLQEIGEACFYECRSITSLSIPGSVKKIDNEAFMGCSLRSLSLGEGIEEIGSMAFYYFASSDEEGYTTGSAALTEVTLPDSLKKLGASAFSTSTDSSPLASVTFEAGLEELGSAPFGKAKIASLSLSEKARQNFVIDDMTLYSKDYSKVYYCTPAKNGTLNIHSGAKEILPYAFYSVNQATAVNFPSTLEKIDEGAFAGAFKYGSGATLSFPSSLKSIGDEAFYFADALLTSTSFQEGLESIGDSVFALGEMASTTVDGAKVYDDLVFPASLKSIGEEAFSSIRTLRKVTFKEGLESIGKEAFRACSLDGEIALPSTLKELGEAAFTNGNQVASFSSASSLFTVQDNLLMDASKTRVYAYASGSKATSVTLPSTVLTIDAYAFSSSKNLEALKLNEGLKNVGEYAFADCTRIAKIAMPESATNLSRRLFYGWGSAQTVSFAYTKDAILKYFISDLIGSTAVNVVYGTKESL